MTNHDMLAINTIRILSAEGVQKANSGHPGLPIGSAPMAYTLFAKHLNHNPANPGWDNRDRFILSAGHGSMLLYSMLHLFGYGVTMDDIKSFRQWGSITPGHPEYGLTPGVETTTGPLGQGIAMSVGFAMAEAHLASVFNRPGFDVVDHYTYVLSGDGCLQEGISSEASSLAGHLGLGKLILLYDRNRITIEGSIGDAFTEDVKMRYQAYGWHVQEVADGNTDVDAISNAIAAAKKVTDKPSIIVVNTEIGYGCPALQGSAKCHGSPLGEENIAALKENLGWKYKEPFTVPDEVKEEIAGIKTGLVKKEEEWNAMFAKYAEKYPELAELYKKYAAPVPVSLFEDESLWSFDKPMATRQSSGEVLNRLAQKLPNIMGGSADLAPSNNSLMKGKEYFSKENREGTNLHFGIREFAMAAICNGITLHGGLHAYCATFLVFSDYMKSALRSSALMELPVTYILTHDSIGVGEDGPTHEPIEHMAMLRSIPGTYTFRPADSKETAAAYQVAFTGGKPTCIALTRQTLPLYEETGKGALRGGYILKDSKDPKVILIGTGSEVELCVKAYEELAEEGISARVVSMPCTELFDEQSDSYKESVLPKSITARVAVEAATPFGWCKYVGLNGDTVTIDHFGASAPAGILFKEFGFTVDNVVKKAMAVLKK
jgi:transketolase